MKAAALVFLAAGAFAAALILGAVSLGSASRSPQPIALHEAAHRGTGAALPLNAVAPGERRVEVRQRVELTTLSAYRAQGRAGAVH